MTEYNIGPCGCCGGDCHGYPQTPACLWAGNVSSITDLDEIKNRDYRTDKNATLPFVASSAGYGAKSLTMAATNQTNWQRFIGNSWNSLLANGYVTDQSPLRLRVTIVQCCYKSWTEYYYVSLTTGKINGANFPPARFDPTKDSIYIELQPFLCPEGDLPAQWTVPAGTALYASHSNCLPCSRPPSDGIDVTFRDDLLTRLNGVEGELGDCGYVVGHRIYGHTAPMGGNFDLEYYEGPTDRLVPQEYYLESGPDYGNIWEQKLCFGADKKIITPELFLQDMLMENGDATGEYEMRWLFANFSKCDYQDFAVVYANTVAECHDYATFSRDSTNNTTGSFFCNDCGKVHSTVNIRINIRSVSKSTIPYSLDLDEIENIAGSRDVRGVFAQWWAHPMGNVLNTSNIPGVITSIGSRSCANGGSINLANINWRKYAQDPYVDRVFYEQLGNSISGSIPSSGGMLPITVGTGNWAYVTLTFATDKTPNWSAIVDSLCDGTIQGSFRPVNRFVGWLGCDFYVAVKL